MFALCAHLAEYLSLDLERILGGMSGGKEARKPLVTTASAIALETALELGHGACEAGHSNLDIGQKIARPVASIVSDDMESVAQQSTPPPSDSKSDPARAETPVPPHSSSPPGTPKQDSPDPDFPEPTAFPTEPIPPSSTIPQDTAPKVTKKKKRAPVDNTPGLANKKKKKRNDIDDIFGF